MDVAVSGNWILRVSQVPNVDRWVAIVVVSHDELSRDLWIPGHLDLPLLDWSVLLLLAKVVVTNGV